MNSDKKKRLIIPVATLMVAIVMMAGVGYAAVSSTFTVDENSTVGGEFSVTVVDYNNTNKLLNGVKIPYVVETLNGNPTNKVKASDDEYVLVENVTVKVTNNTGGAADCSISGSITAGSLKAEVKDAISFEFYNGGTKVTLVNVGDGAPVTLTMKVVLKVTSDILITNPSTELDSTDITIEIVASKA